MRAREDIIKDIAVGDVSVGVDERGFSKFVKAESVNSSIIIEVLLDIRELLSTGIKIARSEKPAAIGKLPDSPVKVIAKKFKVPHSILGIGPDGVKK